MSKMLPKKHDFTFKRGDGWTLTISATTAVDGAFDLTGSRLILQVRKHPDATTAIQTFDMSYSGTADEGIFQATVDANTTADLSIGRFVYDAELILSGLQPITIAEGAFTITSDTSRLESYAGSAAETASTLLQISVGAGGSVDTGLVNATDIAVVISQFGGAGAATVGDNSITNAKLSDMATGTIKGRASAATGDPEDLSPAQVRALLNVADNAQANVKPDWNAAGGTDAEILNKPSLGSAAAQDSSAFAAASHGHNADEIDDTATVHKFVTQAEKDKLAGLESSKFLGTYTNLSALQTAHPSPTEGSYAHVDAGVGNEVQVYIWDNDNLEYFLQASASTAETAATVKTKYESNPDTNAFTDARRDKLDNTETTAELNARDTANRDRANHTGSQDISTVSGLESALNDRLQNITGLVSAGSNVTVTGAGTAASPYVIASNASGGGGTTDPNVQANINRLAINLAELNYSNALADLNFKGGWYDIFADTAKVNGSGTNILFDTLASSNIKGIAQLEPVYYSLIGATKDSGQEVDVSSQTTTPLTVRFSADRTKMYILGDDTIYQYSVSTTDNLTTVTLDSGVTFTFAGVIVLSDFYWTQNGNKFIVCDSGLDELKEFDVPTPYVLTGATDSGNSISLDTIDTISEAIFVSPDESKLFIAGNDANTIFQIDLPTAGTLSGATATVVKSFNHTAIENDARAFTFNENGRKLFIAGRSNDTIYQFDLITGYELDTINSTPSSSLNIGTQILNETNPTGLEFNADGTYLFVTGFGTDKVHRLNTGSGGFSSSGNFSSITHDLTTDLTSNPTEAVVSIQGSLPTNTTLSFTLTDGTNTTASQNVTFDSDGEFETTVALSFTSRNTLSITFNLGTSDTAVTPEIDNYAVYFK